MLKLSHIHLNFHKSIINDGEIVIPNCFITVLTGESGSGKTSLLSEIAFISNYASKEYFIDSKDVKTMTRQDINDLKRNQIAIVSQNPQLIQNMTAKENFEFFSEMTANNMLEYKTEEFMNLLNLNIDRNEPVKNFSGGEKQRLSILCAILKDTPIIVMDEPTAYLDQENIDAFIKVIQILRDQFNKTILIATHNQDVIDICDVHYHISDCQIECLKYAENKDKKETKKQSHCISMKSLNHFFRINYQKNKISNSIMQLLITILLTVCCSLGVFFENYQKQLNEEVLKVASTQIVLIMDDVVSNEKISRLKDVEHIGKVEVYSDFMTDNNYLIVPYLSNDYFKNYIYEKKENVTGIYGNYEVARHNQKNTDFTIKVEKKEKQIKLNYYLNILFEDYEYNTVCSKKVYVPYPIFDNLTKELHIEKRRTPMVLIQIDDKINYEQVLDAIKEIDKNAQVMGHTRLVEMLKIKDKFSFFSHFITKFIFIVVSLAFLILKLIDLYKTRLDYIVLEVNGIPNRDIHRLTLKKELYILVLPIIVSIISVIVLLCFMNLFQISMLKEIFIFVCSFLFLFIIVDFLILYFMKCVFKTEEILKKENV